MFASEFLTRAPKADPDRFQTATSAMQGLQRQVADLEARHKVAKESQAAAEGEVERLSAALKDVQVGYQAVIV